MADVVVVGAGLGGMAVAALLAKLRHRVIVCERTSAPGGALHRVEHEGFSWDAGPGSTTLPAVLRDLFRKSGRPIERYVDLQLRAVARRHVFEDKSYVDLPTGSRAAQISAVDAGLGAGAGQRWAEFVDGQAGAWDVLRERVLDDPLGGSHLGDRDVVKMLSSSTSLAKLLRRSLKDDRLRVMAAHPFVASGSEPRDVPAWGAVEAYVERSFGVWSIATGLASVTAALATRLSERGVEVRYECSVAAITSHDNRVTGVETSTGQRIPADVVVTDISPNVVFGELLAADLATDARRAFASATPAIPPAVTHLGLSGDVPDLPDEVVLHGDPLLVVTTRGQAPEGHHAWTVQRRGSAQEDVLITLVRRGIDVRDQVVSRVDRSAVDLVHETGGSSYGIAWDGWRAQARRSAHLNPFPGLHLVGACVHPGGSIPYVAWGAAHAAARITSPA